MAPDPMLQPDASDSPQTGADVGGPPAMDEEEQQAGLFLAHLATTLANSGGGPVSSDLAVDLVLHEIGEQARLATTASGALIALLRDDELVCRAVSGDQAPGLGVRLNLRSGLSGACYMTGEVQSCIDTELDTRVDAAAARELGLRSVLVVPILDGAEFRGLFEIFSPRPHAFGDRDVQTLQALSRRIVQTLKRAVEAAPGSEEPATLAPVLVVPQEPPGEEPGIEPAFVLPPHVPPHILTMPVRDIWTDVLTFTVLVLALVLGWMVGRSGIQRMAHSDVRPPVPSAAPSTPPVAPSSAPAERTEAKLPAHPPARPKPKASAELPPGGLVIYDKGKVIYRALPLRAAAPTEQAASRSRMGAEDAASSQPEVVRRVEPEYPKPALQAGIHGPVVLDVAVAPDGSVIGASVVSGDAALTSAALAAVRQWRFRPSEVSTSAAPRITQVTLNFDLPPVN
jgi:TonB family protein